MSGLEYATDTKAEVVGKPEKSFFLDAIRDLNCDPARTVMVGDVGTSCYVYFCMKYILL